MFIEDVCKSEISATDIWIYEEKNWKFYSLFVVLAGFRFLNWDSASIWYVYNVQCTCSFSNVFAVDVLTWYAKNDCSKRDSFWYTQPERWAKLQWQIRCTFQYNLTNIFRIVPFGWNCSLNSSILLKKDMKAMNKIQELQENFIQIGCFFYANYRTITNIYT